MYASGCDSESQLPASTDALIFSIHFGILTHSIKKTVSQLVSQMLGGCRALSGGGALVLFSAFGMKRNVPLNPASSS